MIEATLTFCSAISVIRPLMPQAVSKIVDDSYDWIFSGVNSDHLTSGIRS